MRAFLVIAVAASLAAQQPVEPTQSLMQARQILADRDKHLPDYTCVQTVDRRYYTRRRTQFLSRGCDEIRSLGSRDLILESTDRLRLDLKVSQGLEIGSWADSQFTARDIFDLVGAGPYGTGMLGALISDIFVNGGASYRYTGEETSTGTELFAYSFQVPVAASHYRVKAGSNWVPSAFSGAFWLDAHSLDLSRLTVETRNLPPETGACEAHTVVDYQKVQVGDGTFLLPRQSSMRLLMQDETETRILAVYSGCREYRGEATIRFDQVTAGGEVKSGQHPALPLPEDLPLSLALTAPIDTDTAAAGDVVRAKVRVPVRDTHSKAVLVPAGAAVQGRIIQMQHWLDRPRQFRISIALEKLETDGTPRPLYARIYRKPSTSTTLMLPPVGQSPLVAEFAFTTNKSRYRVPAGYASNWITVEPPPYAKK